MKGSLRVRTIHQNICYKSLGFPGLFLSTVEGSSVQPGFFLQGILFLDHGHTWEDPQVVGWSCKLLMFDDEKPSIKKVLSRIF